MGHFPPAEHHYNFDFIAFTEQLVNDPYFGFIIMVADFRPESHLTNINDFLAFPLLPLFPFLSISIFTVVKNTADRRRCCRRYFYQVKTLFSGHLKGLSYRQNAELFTIVADEAYLFGSDSFIYR
jgi:hypothetical protein